jgi:hypothetical protein
LDQRNTEISDPTIGKWATSRTAEAMVAISSSSVPNKKPQLAGKFRGSIVL